MGNDGDYGKQVGINYHPMTFTWINFRDMGIQCFLNFGDICHISFRDIGYFSK